MSMKPEFFCCIGAELKDEIAGSLKSSRMFLYRAAESQTIADMLADGFFNDADDLRVNDLILLYCPEQTISNALAKVSSISSGVVKTSRLAVDFSSIQPILDAKVNTDGTSIMTAPLKMASGSMRGAFSPYLNGVGFFKMDSEGTLTQIATLSDTQFLPATTNAIDFGSSTRKWKDLYLSGDEYLDNGKHIRFNGTASNRYFDIYNSSDDILYISSKYGSYEASLSFKGTTGWAVLYPNNDNQAIFGLPTRRWNKIYASNLCSDTTGANVLIVPNKSGTLATIEDISVGYHPELLSFQWSDHEIEDMSWLRADTFSWQSGTTYSEAYDHLVDDIDGKSLTSETISGTTVQFYLADDGHKICPASQESNVTAIYNATGVAWYYIYDSANTRFKLPRTKFGMTGLRDTVGKYVEAGLPNITGSAEVYWESQNATVGAFYADTSRNNSERNNNTGNPNLGFDASRSSSIYGNSTTVQPPATQMYLYFYVGTFTQTALENTAGLNASLFNEKADVNLLNTANNVDFVIESQLPTAENDYTWYRKYKSGWVEQGGYVPATGSGDTLQTVNLPKAMNDAHYTVTTSLTDITAAFPPNWGLITVQQQTTTGFKTYAGSDWGKYWEVKGMAAS